MLFIPVNHSVQLFMDVDKDNSIIRVSVNAAYGQMLPYGTIKSSTATSNALDAVSSALALPSRFPDPICDR